MSEAGGPPWPVAIFAHNEERNIAACIDSLDQAARGHPVAIFVLANGCRDATARIVRELAARRGDVRLVEIALGDKANAWNVYVHDHAPPSQVHFFIDGDVRADSGALAILAETLAESDQANAAGAVPSAGRDRAGIAARMRAGGRISGNLYALSGAFLARLRQANMRLPLGFIGEDWLVSALAKGDYSTRALTHPSPKLVLAARATFSFRSLDPHRLRDWSIYAHRLIRYRLREHQFAMLFELWANEKRPMLPESADALYAETPVLPRYRWRGARFTLFDALAVRSIRRRARSLGRLR
ncbi:MAG TPA: glycosyltransferase [Stellaceae bacterium]|nr:glycosyltransferase [Stellaceae bacterium]